jgi:hypothetical protein
MLEIKNSSKELDKKETYFLTKSQASHGMKEVVGQTLDMEVWAIYEETDQDGQIRTIFSCKTPEGEIYGTNSEAFIKAFYDILDCFDPEEVTSIEVIGGKSKNNRDFITCAFAE